MCVHVYVHRYGPKEPPRREDVTGEVSKREREREREECYIHTGSLSIAVGSCCVWIQICTVFVCATKTAITSQLVQTSGHLNHLTLYISCTHCRISLRRSLQCSLLRLYREWSMWYVILLWPHSLGHNIFLSAAVVCQATAGGQCHSVGKWRKWYVVAGTAWKVHVHHKSVRISLILSIWCYKSFCQCITISAIAASVIGASVALACGGIELQDVPVACSLVRG